MQHYSSATSKCQGLIKSDTAYDMLVKTKLGLMVEFKFKHKDFIRKNK